MELVAAFVADQVGMDSAGKLDATGIFGHLGANEYPAELPSFSLAILFTVPIAEVTPSVRVIVEMVGDDEERTPVVGMVADAPFGLSRRRKKGAVEVWGQAVLDFERVVVPSEGVYWLHYNLNGHLTGKVRLRVAPILEVYEDE